MSLVISRAYPLALQLTEPEGFWSMAGRGEHCQDGTRRFSAYRSDAVCPPPAVNGTPRTVTAPVGPVRGVGTRLSNLDLNGRLVNRGVVVSANGFRYLVVKVSRGFAYGRFLNLLGRHPAGKTTTRLVCEWVQVVQ
jgi:hypothetical protein